MSLSKYYDVIDIVYAGFRPNDELWHDTKYRKWVSMPDKSLKTMVEIVLDSIRDTTTPKNIVVMFFQRFVGGTDIELMRSYVQEIVQETQSQKWNKCSIATCWFTPSHQPVWGTVAIFNKIAHKANEDMGISRMNLHKCLMKLVDPDGPDYTLRNNGSMWSEFQLGLALGSILSFEGMRKVVNSVHKTLDSAFKFCETEAGSHPAKENQPPTLDVTPGWNRNRFMRQILEDRGLIPSEREQGARRMMMSDQKPSGWENWHVFKDGPLRRFNEREGNLEAQIWLQRRADEIPVWGTDNQEPEQMEINEESAQEEAVANSVQEEAVVNSVQEEAVVNSEDEPYDPEEEWIADKDIQIEFVNKPNGEVEVIHRRVAMIDTSAESCVDEIEDGDADENGCVETQKQKQENYNEDDKEWIKELTRALEIEKEKTKAYRAEIEHKDLAIAREKATVRYWKQQIREVNEKVVALEKEVEGAHETMRFMRSTYKAKEIAKNKKKF